MADPRLPLGRRTLSPGTRLNGLYEIDALVASGGMGEIYRAHAIQTDDTVAIKMMLPEFADNEQALALFRKEASALHKLAHEAIVRYYVFSVEPTLHRPYLAMEFVEGHTLSQLLARGPLTYEATVALMKRIAGGLQAAHERGIIHRDVTPDNIIIPSGGDVARAKIIDFGIAKSTEIGSARTVIGVGFAGKSNYVSPEQLGLYGGHVTAKSDIYSFGLVLAQALTGKPLNMGGNQVEVIEKRHKVPDLGNIEMRFRPLIDRMLQPSPNDRPESMAAVASWPLGAPQLLRRRNLDDLNGTAPKAADQPPARRRIAKSLIAAGVGGLAVLGGAGAAVYWLSAPPPRKPDAVAPALQTAEAPPVRPTEAPPPVAAATVTATPPPGTPSLTAPSLTPAAPPSTAAAPALIRPPTPAPAVPGATAPSGWGSAGQPYQPPPPPDTASGPTLAAPPSVTPAPAPPALPPAPAVVPPRQSEAAAPADLALNATPAPPAAPRTELPPSRIPDPVSSGVQTPSTAMLPPALPEPPVSAERIRRYIAGYDGGECFFAAPVAVTDGTARIEGYGATVRPFEKLDEAFKREHGFEADIGLRQVALPQCPAVTFLRRTRGAHASIPRVSITETNLKPGQPITGSIEGPGGGHLEFLLVSDTGSVQNLTSLLKSTPGGKSFNLKMQRTSGSGAQPQLLLAVTSAKPLQAFRLAQPSPADQVFAQAAGEAARTGQVLGAEMKYFKLER